MALVKCPECGRDVAADAPTCPNCGTPVAARQAATRTAAAQEREKRSRGKAFVFILGLVLFIGIASAINSSRTPSSARPLASGGDSSDSIPGIDSSFGWTITEDKSPMDNSPTVVLGADADSEVKGWLDKKRPTLIVRCKEHRVEVYVVTGMAANVELGEFEQHTVRIRLDSGSARTEKWSESSDDKALFSPNGRRWFTRLAQANQMIFQFTPFKANPATVTFDLRGLHRYKDKITKACPA